MNNWTLKVKLLNLLNHISYFNIICRICCRNNTHIQILKVWFKSMLPLLKYRMFSRGLFLLAHPVGACMTKCAVCLHVKCGLLCACCYHCQSQHGEFTNKYQSQLKDAKKLIEDLEMEKSLSVAAAKQELHAALESKDEELVKANEHIKELDAENKALKHNLSQGWY